MNFKEFYYNIFLSQVITEDYDSILKQITKIIEINNLEKSAVDNILDIYNNVIVDEGREKAKKDSDLVALTYIYISKILNDNEIKDLYSSYLNSETSKNKNLLSAYTTELQNEIRGKGLFKNDKKEEKLSLISDKTQKLIEDIHRYQKKEEFKGSVLNEENDKVYEDKDIIVFKADSKQKCIYYGRNSNLCISTKSGNYYWKYRMGKMRGDDLGMTTYFVYWKKNDGSIDENKRILIDSLGDENGEANKYSWNPISPNSDRDISENELISKFPVLQKPFNNNVFKFLPYAEDEKRFQWIEENVRNASQLESYKDYEMWMQTDSYIESTDWEIIEKKLNDKEMRKILLLAAELGKNIPLNLTEKYFSEKEKERYLNKISEDSTSSHLYARDVLKGQNVPDIILQSISKDSRYSQRSLTEATLNSLSTDVIRSNSTNINSIEDRNFSSDYSADASSVIRDSRMDGFIGEGIFDDSNQLVGYGYGYRMGADGEYSELEYIDTNEITFFNDNFKDSVITNGIENICTPKNTFYISNLVVDKPYRLYVKRLLNGLLNRISNGGYKYIAFDGLSDTIRLFDSTRKSSRLSGSNLIKLAEVDQGESKLVLFYIK